MDTKLNGFIFDIILDSTHIPRTSTFDANFVVSISAATSVRTFLVNTFHALCLVTVVRSLLAFIHYWQYIVKHIKY